MNFANSTVSQLADMGAEALYGLLVEETKQGELPDDLNWLGLSEIAASNALVEPNGQNRNIPDKKWVEVALILYKTLADKYPKNKESILLSEMNFRATVIIRSHSITEKKGVYNVLVIKNWFLNSLPFTLDEAKENILIWRKDLSIARILKKLKSNIAVIKRLADSECIELSDDINKWLEIYSELP